MERADGSACSVIASSPDTPALMAPALPGCRPGLPSQPGGFDSAFVVEGGFKETGSAGGAAAAGCELPAVPGERRALLAPGLQAGIGGQWLANPGGATELWGCQRDVQSGLELLLDPSNVASGGLPAVPPAAAGSDPRAGLEGLRRAPVAAMGSGLGLLLYFIVQEHARGSVLGLYP